MPSAGYLVQSSGRSSSYATFCLRHCVHRTHGCRRRHPPCAVLAMRCCQAMQEVRLSGCVICWVGLQNPLLGPLDLAGPSIGIDLPSQWPIPMKQHPDSASASPLAGHCLRCSHSSPPPQYACHPYIPRHCMVPGFPVRLTCTTLLSGMFMNTRIEHRVCASFACTSTTK